jgi:hypothetical protein
MAISPHLGEKKAWSAFALSATVVAICACGRQVTPNPPGLGPGGAPPGYIAFFFNTEAAFNFSQYQYMIVLNTSGSRVTPSTDTWQTNWAGYVFDLIATGNGIESSAKPYYLQHNSNPHIAPGWYFLGTTPQLFSYNLNDNGTGTEFSILAQRRIFDYNPSPSPSPSSTPSNLWTFNAFVAVAQSGGGNWYFYDSMGAGGPTDPQYASPSLCMTEPFDQTFFPQGTFAPGDPAAQIVSIEIANNPISPSPCP